MFWNPISNIKDPTCIVLNTDNFGVGSSFFFGICKNCIPCWLQLNLLQPFSEAEDVCPLFYSTEAQHMLFTVLCCLQYNKAQAGDMCFRRAEFSYNCVVLSSLWLLCCEITEAAYFVPNFIVSFPPFTCKGNKITLHLLSAKLNSCRISTVFPVASMFPSTCW